MDDQIASIDRMIFLGTNPVTWLESYVSQPLSEWMSFAYTVYGFLFLFVIGLFFMKEDRKPFRHASFALCSAFALGYLGYILAPVKGPLFTQHFSTDLGIYYTKDIKAALMDRYRIEYDCFPSLHTAIGLILSWECWRSARAVFWISLPVIVSIPIACVYLRYHYVTDVLAGALLALGVATLMRALGDKVFGQIPA
jgi:membrane-associated phospholipid phosphatase